MSVQGSAPDFEDCSVFDVSVTRNTFFVYNLGSDQISTLFNWLRWLGCISQFRLFGPFNFEDCSVLLCYRQPGDRAEATDPKFHYHHWSWLKSRQNQVTNFSETSKDQTSNRHFFSACEFPAKINIIQLITHSEKRQNNTAELQVFSGLDCGSFDHWTIYLGGDTGFPVRLPVDYKGSTTHTCYSFKIADCDFGPKKETNHGFAQRGRGPWFGFKLGLV
jgi:hypothetical protein